MDTLMGGELSNMWGTHSRKLLRFIMIYCQEATEVGRQGRKEEKEKSNTNNHDASWCCISMICEVCTE